MKKEFIGTSRKVLGPCIVFVILSIAAFHNTLNSFFVSDDFGIVNEMISGAVFYFPNFIRHFTSWTWAMDYAVWGISPFGFHLTSTVLHGLNAAAIYFIVMEWTSIDAVRLDKKLLAWFAGLLFVLMPNHMEAIAWTAARADPVATFFLLFSFLAYLRYKNRGNWVDLLAALVLFSAALFSKESAISFPAIILPFELYAFRPRDPSGTSILRRLQIPSLFFALFGAYLVVRTNLLGELISGYGSSMHLRLLELPIAYNLLNYSARSILPAMPTRQVLFVVFFVLASVIVVAMLVVRKQRVGDWSSFRTCWLIAPGLAMLPVINLGVSEVLPDGERMLYLSSAFAVIAIVMMADYIIVNEKYLKIALVLVLITFLPFLFRNNEAWNFTGDYSLNLSYCLEEKAPEITEESFLYVYLDCMDNNLDKTAPEYFRRVALSRFAPPPGIINCARSGRSDCLEGVLEIGPDPVEPWIRIIRDPRFKRPE